MQKENHKPRLRSEASPRAGKDSRIILENDNRRAFGKINLYLMGGCLLLIIVGFLLMLGGGSTPEQFNPDIFSTRRIVIGPALTFLGFLLMAFAIIYKPHREKDGMD